jgi:elongation factor Ts
MKITAEQVKQLRDQTGAPMMECKKALEEAQGKLEDAFTVLRKRGQAAAAKRAGRATQEGVVGSYIHAGGKIGVIVELNCETDFVARTPEFKDLAHDLAMHIAAADPRFLQKEDVSGEALAKEREVIRAQAATSGKPPAVMERIVQGRLGKFYEEACLYEQHFVRDPAQTIGELIRSKVAKFGENINVSRFSRFKIGEWPNASSDHPKITSVSSH